MDKTPDPQSRPISSDVKIDKEGLRMTQHFFDGTRLMDITDEPEGMRLMYVRLEQGTLPTDTLLGEAHVDVAEDGRVLGFLVELTRPV